jgi:isoleucyl-tRNA synthetase
MKVRQPLRRALLVHPGEALDDGVRAEIADELNVKLLEDVESLAELMSWTVVPNFRRLGPRLGPAVNDVKRALADADGAALRRQLDSDGFVTIAGERLDADDVEVRATSHQDFAVAQDGAWAVALDLELDDDLRGEGMARELIRALNDLRKERGLQLTDRIDVRLDPGPRVRAAVDAHGEWIATEVLAQALAYGDGEGDGDARDRLDIDGEAVDVVLRVV